MYDKVRRANHRTGTEWCCWTLRGGRRRGGDWLDWRRGTTA